MSLIQTTHAPWKGTTAGMPWMQRSLIGLLKWLDVRWLYGVMALVVPFYMLLAHKGYIATYRFFRRHGEGSMRALVSTYRNHYAFGQIILDRFAVYAGRRFELTIEGYDKFLDLCRRPEGFIMLSAHVGNYELAGYTLVAETKRLNALVYGGETETVMANRRRVWEAHNINMIPVAADMSHIFKLNNALRDGEIVSLPADRIFGSAKAVKCPFMGGQAPLPLGPFAMAVQRDAPVVTVFVMKETSQRYHIYIDLLTSGGAQASASTEAAIAAATPTETPRERMEILARRYTSRLEQIVSHYPYQWFNYYDFWK